MFFKTIAIKKFVNFTEKTCVRVFFNKVAGPQNSNFIQKRLQQRFFPVKFAKFLRKTCFTDYLQRLLLPVQGFLPAALLKRRIRQRCFPVNFTGFLRTSFDWTHPDDCSLCLSENFEKFFRKPLLQSNLFQVSTTRYSKELFHKCFSRILCKNDK